MYMYIYTQPMYSISIIEYNYQESYLGFAQNWYIHPDLWYAFNREDRVLNMLKPWKSVSPPFSDNPT